MEVPQPAVNHMEVFVGMAAFLPCDIRGYNKAISKVVVSRDDLNPSKYVHIQEQGADRYGPQNKLFNGRTSWSDTLGGLFLNEAQFSDSGTYNCTLSQLGEMVHEGLKVVTQTQIQLDVKETCGHEFPSSPAPVFLLSCLVGIILIILVIAAVVAFHLWKKTRADRTITVREGESSVNLPFQITTALNPGDRVEWLVLESKVVYSGHNAAAAERPGVEENVLMLDQPKVVYRHVIGANNPEIPHKSHGGHTQMPDLQKNDLTLTLQNPCPEDSGTYTCTVRRGETTLHQKVTKLLVKKPSCFRRQRTTHQSNGMV